MNETALTWYLAAPTWVQHLILSGYGAWLRHLRYGAIHNRVLADLRGSERWGAVRHRAAQLERLGALVRYARSTVPFYRERMPGVVPRDLSELARLPILSKDEVRRAGATLVGEARGRQHRIHTGGTTGTPLTIHCDSEALQVNYAFFSRFLESTGVAPRPRVATFAGRTIVPPAQRGPPYWRHNFAARTLLCSSYHLSPESIPHYVAALRRFGPELIDSYPSSLLPIARHLLEFRIDDLRPRAVVTSSETLTPEARDLLTRAFGCPVFDHYGSAEMVAFVTQCAHGAYHCNPEYGILEVITDGRPARPGEVGEVVATGFVNRVMPLIRYATGDLAEAGEEGCACGRAFPVLRRLIGRLDDVIVTPEGRRVGRLDPVFKEVRALVETRIVQDTHDHIRVEAVLDGPWSEDEQRRLLGELGRRLGPTMRIDLVPVPRLERGRGGKLRGVVNLVGAPPNDAAGAEHRAGRGGGIG